MTGWKLPWSASCVCGRVKMRVTAPPVVSMACHCRGCQKLTSGAYALTLMVPADGFAVLEGKTELGGLHRPETQHHFCAWCKNWLYTTGIAAGRFVNFRPTMLDDATWVTPFIDVCVSEKMPGVVSGAQRSYPVWPPPEDYAPLMEAYAREGARPN